MPRFIWLGDPQVAMRADLRARGWRLVGEDAGNCLILIDGHHRASLHWRTPGTDDRQLRELRRWVLMFGVTSTQERLALLRMGIGDAIGDDFALDELAVRARRVLIMATSLPRSRCCGPLRLELLARDGYVSGKRLGLHPREFALAWRLMEAPGQPVDKVTLLRDVWQLDFTPETNSLAVHARRLRAKLEVAGVADLIRTSPGGGYALHEPVPPG